MSYNALHVPLDIGTWSCELILAREYYSLGGGFWDPFASSDKRREQERQIEDDCLTFDLYFRPDYDFRFLIRTEIDAITSFLSDHLNVAHWNLPTNNAGIERALKQAVADGKLVPIINRDWRARTQTYRPTPAPLRWPPSTGGSGSAQALPYDGLSAVVSGGPTLAGAATVIESASGHGTSWLGSAVTAAEEVMDEALGNASDAEGVVARTLLGDAQPFGYQPDMPSGDSFDIAKTPNSGEPGTWYTNPGSGQMRLFGNDGNPVLDLDFDHFHNGLKPHAHNWNGGVRDGGNDVVPFSPWRP